MMLLLILIISPMPAVYSPPPLAAREGGAGLKTTVPYVALHVHID